MLAEVLALALSLSAGQVQVTENQSYGPETLIHGRLTSDVAYFGLVRQRVSGRLAVEVVGHDPVPCPAPSPPAIQVWVLKTDGTSLSPDRTPVFHPVRGDDGTCTYWWEAVFPTATRAEIAGAVLKVGDRIFAKKLDP